MSASNTFFYIKDKIRRYHLEAIKEKIEKLLRLSLSENRHEAELAARRAMELMQRYALDHGDIFREELVTREFEVDYARIPIWLRELYGGLSSINGVYMVWIDGYRYGEKKKSLKKARIVLTGRESDILNTEYLLTVFLREIERKSAEYGRTLGRVADKRSLLNSYRIGLGRGLCERLLEATEYVEHSSEGRSLVPVSHDDRYEISREFYIRDNEVKSVESRVKRNLAYYAGVIDAKDVEINRPVTGKTADDDGSQHLIGR